MAEADKIDLSKLTPTDRLKLVHRGYAAEREEKKVTTKEQILGTEEGREEQSRYQKELEECQGSNHRLTIVSRHNVAMSKLERLNTEGKLTKAKPEKKDEKVEDATELKKEISDLKEKVKGLTVDGANQLEEIEDLKQKITDLEQEGKEEE